MEQYDRAADRKRAAIRNQWKPPEIWTVGDIQSVLTQLDPKDRLNKPVGDVTLTTQMEARDERDKSRIFQVNSTSSNQNHRDILIEGFALLRRRKDVVETADQKKEESVIVIGSDACPDGREMPPPDVITGDDASLAIDPLIERLLGGYRSGNHICWDLSDGFTYRYEIFQHRLTRRETSIEDRTASGAIPQN